MRLQKKLENMPWGILLVMAIISGIGLLMLYSAAGENFNPWAYKQLIRLGVGIVIIFCFALVPLQIWLRMSYGVYIFSLLSLVVVHQFGIDVNGAQRWLGVGGFRFQPSELTKVAVILAMAKLFHSIDIDDINRPQIFAFALALFLVPALLIWQQPDLGTALIILVLGGGMLVIAGLSYWYFLISGGLMLVVAPLGWFYGLQPYQKQRIVTFFDSSTDTLGAGYHVAQAKIALGSGGLTGKGLFLGTQSRLDFLPEKHTDFIVAVFAEETGLLGVLALLFLYLLLIIGTYRISLQCVSHFGRLVACGAGLLLFSYVFVNLAMISNVLPVVGVPLPLVSYGGSAIITICCMFGLVSCIKINSKAYLSWSGHIV